LGNDEDVRAVVDPSGLAAKSLLSLLQLAYDVLAAGQTVDEIPGPIGIRGKPADEDVDRPEIHDDCMRCEQRLERLGTIEVERQQVLGSILEHKLKFTATAILVIFLHLFAANDATRGRASESTHRRNHSVAGDAAKLLGYPRQRALGQMIENYVIARDNVEVPIGPGQRVSKVVGQELEFPPAIWVPRRESLGLPARNFQLALRDIDANGVYTDA
jgi:hypothetical protein